MTASAGRSAAPGGIQLTPRSGKDFVNEVQVPWTPWVMPGTSFKLFCVNYQTGGFTMLLKIEPGADTRVYKHIGASEAFLLEGDIRCNEIDRGTAGDYFYKGGGVVDRPRTANGCILFAMAHGPSVELDPGGQVILSVDATTMMQLARANRAHEHVAEVGKI